MSKYVKDLMAGALRQRLEGVEEARQIELISSFGVDLFQGYHLGRPMPRQELSRRLTDTPAKATPVERQI